MALVRTARQDGLVNAFTGLGDDEIDMRMHTVREPSYQRPVYEYEAEWRDNAYARREVSQLAGDIFRAGVDLVNVKPDTVDVGAVTRWIEGDTTNLPDGSISRTRGLLYYSRRTIEQGDKVAGAALYAIVDDGMDPVHPLDWRRIQRIVAWEVLDRSELIPYVSDGMGTEPEYWMLSDALTVRTGTNGKRIPLQPGQVIHRSRLWFHKGVQLGRREERKRQWWGASVLDLNWGSRRAIEEGILYANTYLHRSSWIHMQIAELNELYDSTDEDGNDIGVELIDRRMRQFRRIASTQHIALTDGGKQGSKSAETQQELAGRNPDKIESVVERTGDLVPIVELNITNWQTGTGMPPSIADGSQSSPLRGGKNEGDWQSWQGTVERERDDKDVDGLVNWQLLIVFASREGPTHGLVPDWSLQWRPLHVPSAQEKAEQDKARAEADNARIAPGVVTADEVRQQRIINGDIDGQLRATEVPDDEKTAVVPPAQVGIATAMLTGAISVAKGEVGPEWYESFLLAIDGQRFTPEQAKDMATKAASRVGVGTPAPEGGAGQAMVPATETTLPNAGIQPPALTVDAELPGDERVPEPDAPSEPAPKVDPFAALADIPDDLMTPVQIVDAIKARTGLDVTLQRVHALAKRHGVRSGKVGGAVGYSAGDIADALAKDNGRAEPVPEVPDDNV